MFEGIIVVGFMTGVLLPLFNDELHEAVSTIRVVEVLLAEGLELAASNVPVVSCFSAEVVADCHQLEDLFLDFVDVVVHEPEVG